MSEFDKDANQSAFDKEGKGDKSAFGQFEKGQQSEAEGGEQKGEPLGQDEIAQQKGEPLGQDPIAVGQKGETLGDDKGGQRQYEDKGQRQQGDEDLDEDSKSSLDGQGMK